MWKCLEVIFPIVSRSKLKSTINAWHMVLRPMVEAWKLSLICENLCPVEQLLRICDLPRDSTEPGFYSCLCTGSHKVPIIPFAGLSPDVMAGRGERKMGVRNDCPP